MGAEVLDNRRCLGRRRDRSHDCPRMGCMGEGRFDNLVHYVHEERTTTLTRCFVSLASFPSVSESLGRYTSQTLVPLSGILLFASFLPLDSSFLLGNSGEPILAPLAPLVLFIASGCVAVSWYLLRGTMWVVFRVVSLFGRFVILLHRRCKRSILLYAQHHR